MGTPTCSIDFKHRRVCDAAVAVGLSKSPMDALTAVSGCLFPLSNVSATGLFLRTQGAMLRKTEPTVRAREMEAVTSRDASLTRDRNCPRTGCERPASVRESLRAEMASAVRRSPLVDNKIFQVVVVTLTIGILLLCAVRLAALPLSRSPQCTRTTGILQGRTMTTAKRVSEEDWDQSARVAPKSYA